MDWAIVKYGTHLLMEVKAIQQLALAIMIEITSPISLWNTYTDQDILSMSLNKPSFLVGKVRCYSDSFEQFSIFYILWNFLISNIHVIIHVLDGSKISPMFTDSIGSQSSPLSISVSGRGNDIFLHWMSNCKGHDKETLKYAFSEGEHIHDMVK